MKYSRSEAHNLTKLLNDHGPQYVLLQRDLEDFIDIITHSSKKDMFRC